MKYDFSHLSDSEAIAKLEGMRKNPDASMEEYVALQDYVFNNCYQNTETSEPEPKAPTKQPIPEQLQPKPEPELPYTVETAFELGEADIPDVEWIVDDIIPRGTTTLAGAAKVGKSFLCWNIAMAVAHGGIALSRFNVADAISVGYLAFEDPRKLIQSRLRMIQPDMELPHNLHIIRGFPYKATEKGLVMYEKLIKKYEIQLLIVDTLQHMLPPSNSRSSAYQIDYNQLIPIQKLSHDLDIGLILVTHSRKAVDVNDIFNETQGSMGIQAGCDTQMILRKFEGVYTLHVRGREMAETEYPLQFDNGIWIAQTPEERLTEQVSDTRNVILTLLKDAGDDGLTTSEIVALAEGEGLKESNVKNTLVRMKKSEQILQPKPRSKYYYLKQVSF